MTLSGIRNVSLIALVMLTADLSASAQSHDGRFRPLGASSAVDAYRGPATTAGSRLTPQQPGNTTGGFQARQVATTGTPGSNVRQTVMQQPFSAPQLPATPPGSFAPPPATTSPVPPPGTVVTPAAPPRSLPSNPGMSPNSNLIPVPQDRSILVPQSGDLAPLSQPELSNGFATIDNCNCVSAPSDHAGVSVVDGCAPVSYQAPAYEVTTYQAPVYQTQETYAATPTAAPVVLPNGFAAPPASGAPAGALVSFGQEVYPVQVGQGWWGQPVAYVPGQRFRNWLRYIFP